MAGEEPPEGPQRRSPWTAGGPVGTALQRALSALFGAASVALPVVLAGVGVTLMRTEPDAAARPRRTVGTLLLTLGTLGLWHVAAGAPADAVGRARAAGAVGYLVAEPLVDGFTVWVAVPLLALLAGYGLLVLTGTPVRAVPERIRRLRATAPMQDPDSDTPDADNPDTAVPVTDADPAAARLRRPARRRQASLNEDSGTEQDTDQNAAAEPVAVPTPLPKPATKPAPSMSAHRVVEGDYQLPPPDLLVKGDPPKARSKANDAMIEAITGVLDQFSVDAQVTGFARGPTVTRYE